ncbi:MarR family winged helix-turn-helix transcriptional regulator [Microbacterium gorillae]|uniref:MarR family winged helix-turn-helix transcriptional regulator n=1 Tax=Microbacterium gorillae TaxID=1231063 RepID=UPI00058DC5F0|nr:hypothetical protein [Microbacterium gorillae]
MNTHDENNNNERTDAASIGTLLRAAGSLYRAELRATLAEEDVHPGALRRLRRIAAGSDAHVGGPRTRRLAERGWVTRTDEGIALTPEGTALLERVAARRSALEERLADAIGAEHLEDVRTALGALATELGGEERLRELRAERRGRRRPERGHSPRWGHGHRMSRERGDGFESRRHDRGGFGPGDERREGRGHRREGFGPGFGHRPEDESFRPGPDGFGPRGPRHDERRGGREFGYSRPFRDDAPQCRHERDGRRHEDRSGFGDERAREAFRRGFHAGAHSHRAPREW